MPARTCISCDVHATMRVHVYDVVRGGDDPPVSTRAPGIVFLQLLVVGMACNHCMAHAHVLNGTHRSFASPPSSMRLAKRAKAMARAEAALLRDERAWPRVVAIRGKEACGLCTKARERAKGPPTAQGAQA